jgi:hypothetical protein
MIKQTQQQAKDTRPLKHFTRHQYFDSISKVGIQLEGWNELSKAVADEDNRYFKAFGRYVWLTKGEQAEVINAVAHLTKNEEHLQCLQTNTSPIYVDDEGLEIISWKLLKQQLSRKRKAREVLIGFEKVAQMVGDNTDDWYVSKTPIPSSNLYAPQKEMEVA